MKSFGEASTKQVASSLFLADPNWEGRHRLKLKFQAIDVAAAAATVTFNGSSNNTNNINFSGLGAITQDPN